MKPRSAPKSDLSSSYDSESWLEHSDSFSSETLTASIGASLAKIKTIPKPSVSKANPTFALEFKLETDQSSLIGIFKSNFSFRTSQAIGKCISVISVFTINHDHHFYNTHPNGQPGLCHLRDCGGYDSLLGLRVSHVAVLRRLR